jgi:phosphotransferase system enzyme I (PtsP)
MALIGLGYRSLSMSPSAVGPVKSMILALDAGHFSAYLADLLATHEGNLREPLKAYAAQHGLEV